jgi:hypothetical protein
MRDLYQLNTSTPFEGVPPTTRCCCGVNDWGAVFTIQRSSATGVMHGNVVVLRLLRELGYSAIAASPEHHKFARGLGRRQCVFQLLPENS